MNFVRGIENLKTPLSGCVLTLGNFDGIHLGHQNILAKLKSEARKLNLPSAVIFFEPQPREFFCPKESPARLSSFYEKFTFISNMGIDILCCLRFSSELANMEPLTFIQKILVDNLHVKHLIIGDDFCFGKKRQGNFKFLQEFSIKYQLFTLEKTQSYILDEMRVSSTLIREALASDQLDLAQKLLGRPYAISGKVVHGQQLGRTLGFPTANIQLKRRVCPVKGVYAVSVLYCNKTYQGIANVGSRPTVHGIEDRLEVFLFNFNENIYNKRITVNFLHKLRSEQLFSSVAELKQQIIIDQVNAREYFSLCACENH